MPWPRPCTASATTLRRPRRADARRRAGHGIRTRPLISGQAVLQARRQHSPGHTFCRGSTAMPGPQATLRGHVRGNRGAGAPAGGRGVRHIYQTPYFNMSMSCNRSACWGNCACMLHLTTVSDQSAAREDARPTQCRKSPDQLLRWHDRSRRRPEPRRGWCLVSKHPALSPNLENATGHARGTGLRELLMAT
jgi:hypothetical protein